MVRSFSTVGCEDSSGDVKEGDEFEVDKEEEGKMSKGSSFMNGIMGNGGPSLELLVRLHQSCRGKFLHERSHFLIQ